MPKAGSRSLANGMQESYCLAVARGAAKKDALLAAGYTSSPHGQSYMIENCVGVAARREFLQEEYKDKLFRASVVKNTVTRDQLNVQADEVWRLALEGTPILDRSGELIKYDTGEKDEEGKPVMATARKRDLSSATRSIEVKAKLNGLWIDVNADGKEDLEKLLEGKTNEELSKHFEGLVTQHNPNLKTMLQEKVDSEEKPAESTESQGEKEPTLQ